MTVKIINADVLEGLRTMEDESIQCVVTSPPYYALRDYGTGEWEGGDPECNHQIIPLFSSKSTIKAPNHKAKDQGIPYKHKCGKCGAIRKDQQIGLEQTPQDYIDKMVEVCREIRRVLRHDGTFWLNIGDSYCSSTFLGNNNDSTGKLGNSKEWKDALHTKGVSRPIPMGLKPKDMMGIPWRIAMALQADGWYLRQDIIWNKPNPMPESVTDRCTKSHEYIFMLTKSAKYFYDAEAVKDPSGANKRDVWNITVKAFKEAHFATFPPELPMYCIKAGTSEKGACPKCGSPLERLQSRVGPDGTEVVTKASTHSARKPDGTALMGNNNQHSDTPLLRTSAGGIAKKGIVQKETVGWAPTCDCGEEETVPCVVYDPFGGSGTTALVANRLGRDAIFTELNPEYCKLAEKRIHSTDPLYVEIAIEKPANLSEFIE